MTLAYQAKAESREGHTGNITLEGARDLVKLPPTADLQVLRPLSLRLRLLYPQKQTFSVVSPKVRL